MPPNPPTYQQPGPEWGQIGITFQALINQLQNNQLNFAQLMNSLNTSVKNLGLIAPTYATGVWTPADNSGAGLSFTAVSTEYTQIGRLVFAAAALTYPATASGASASISGLPVATANAAFATGPAKVYCSASQDVIIRPTANALTASLLNGATGAALTNANLTGATLSFMLVYPTS